tara:strand:- start:6433 stop:7431 length:999 start_codon:yes stop_codon:yes gene_type:complete
MDIDKIGEFGLIEKLRRKIRKPSHRVKLGPGDDCAVVAPPDQDILMTSDTLIEDVHFDLHYVSPEMLGKKSIVVNLSDIAAMGGSPLYILISLGIPISTSVEFVEKLYVGFESMAKKYNCNIIGGDISNSTNGLIISITVVGEIKKNILIRRAGARIRDKIFVTGTLGNSAAGLEILKRPNSVKKNKLIEDHLCPKPRLIEGKILAEKIAVSAMIDLSDGLASDLKRICEESKCGARIYLNKIPLSHGLRRFKKSLNKNILDYALYGGEDYELLFTIKGKKIPQLQKGWRKMKIPITNIGEILDKRHGIILVSHDGKEKTLSKRGYDHFKNN